MVLIWGHLEAIPTFTSQKPWISFFYKTPHQAIYLSRATPTNLAMCKTHRTQNIRALRILWYSFGDICRTFQPSHIKNYEFHFFTKHSTKPSTQAVPHKPTWPCAIHTELKHSCTKNFMVLIWGHLEAIPTFTSQKPWISFFHKTLHQAIYLSRGTSTNLSMCKTHRTQNICAQTILWYSFWDIWRQFQPSYLTNHEFQFFTKHPTPTNLAMYKTHWSQNIHAPRILWYAFGDICRRF